MKEILIKISSVILAILAIFHLGSRSGRKDEKNKQLKEDYDNLQDNIKINKKASKLSFIDKSKLLLSRQQNKADK